MMIEKNPTIVFESRQYPDELKNGRISLYGLTHQHYLTFSFLIKHVGEKIVVSHKGTNYEATIDVGAIMLSGLSILIKDMEMDAMEKPIMWTLCYRPFSQSIIINGEMR